MRASRGEASGPRDPLGRRSLIRAGRNNSLPPAVNATSSDELQPSACRGGGLRGSASRTSTASIHRPHSAKFVLGAPPRAAIASLSPRTAIPHGIALFALPQIQPKARPISPPGVSLTAAPLTLRRISVARGNSCRLALGQPTEYALLRGRATEFLRGSSFFARLRDSVISAHRRNS